jgi:hypothetical protein
MGQLAPLYAPEKAFTAALAKEKASWKAVGGCDSRMQLTHSLKPPGANA